MLFACSSPSFECWWNVLAHSLKENTRYCVNFIPAERKLRGTEVLCAPEMSSLWMWQRRRLSRLCFPSFIISLIFLSCVIWQGYYKHKYIRKYSLSLCPLVSFLNIFLINNRWRSLALKVLLAVTSQQRIIWYSSLSSASFMSPLCLWLSVSQPNFQHAAVLSKNKKLHCRHQVH